MAAVANVHQLEQLRSWVTCLPYSDAYQVTVRSLLSLVLKYSSAFLANASQNGTEYSEATAVLFLHFPSIFIWPSS